MPPKSDFNKMGPAQFDAVFDAMIIVRAVGGDDDGKMVKKAGVVWAILEELYATMPQVIHDLPKGTSYEPMDQENWSCPNNEWCSKYKEVQLKHNVRSYFKVGETGLSGAESVPLPP
jgi:hypothetical protein